jgi:predicted nucleotidyltransferase
MKNAREFANYKRVLARNKIIMQAVVGSEMIGLQSSGSDVDELAVSIETPAQLLGFAPFEHDIYRTAEDRTGKFGVPSGPGDIDLSVYGLRKFVRMCLTGNPNIISMLYLPEKKFTVYTPLAAELQALAPKFASKEVGKAFMGYLKAQRLRLQGLQGQKNVNRQELIERYGYDTKYASHMLRLGMQGYSFMRSGYLTFPMDAADLKLLKRVKDGELDEGTVLDYAQNYEERIKAYVDEGSFRDKPDYEAVEKWLVGVYQREWWNEDATASQQQGTETDQAGPNAGAGKKDGEEIEAEIRF